MMTVVAIFPFRWWSWWWWPFLSLKSHYIIPSYRHFQSVWDKITKFCLWVATDFVVWVLTVFNLSLVNSSKSYQSFTFGILFMKSTLFNRKTFDFQLEDKNGAFGDDDFAIFPFRLYSTPCISISLVFTSSLTIRRRARWQVPLERVQNMSKRSFFLRRSSWLLQLIKTTWYVHYGYEVFLLLF